jgi:5-methylcytosine-specific restriction endonuclease McrA
MPDNYSRTPNCQCSVCFKSIYRRPNEIAKGSVFCSRACVSVAQTILKTCPVCGTQFRSGLNKNTCSKACGNVSRTGIKYHQGRPRCKYAKTRQQKARLIEMSGPVCMRCGYDNVNVLELHHVIERRNGGSDAIENLELLCRNCHGERHLGDSRKKVAESGSIELLTQRVTTDFESV